MKSTMNGTRNVTLVTTLWPVGIDLDRQNKRVFWVEGTNDKEPYYTSVVSVDYDGNNRTVLYPSSWNSFSGITFFSPYLFVSNSSSGTTGVIKLNASNGAFTSYVGLSGHGLPLRLVAYDSSRQLPG